MPPENTKLLKEDDWAGVSPDGFDSTLLDEDRLRELDNQSLSNLKTTVNDYNDYELTESHVVDLEVHRVLTSFLTPERTMELPGTGLAIAADHIKKFAAYYKADNETPSGTVKDSRRASPGDIVFTFANPEVYEEISGADVDTFLQTGLSGGDTLDVIGDAGVDHEDNASDTPMDLDNDEMMFFTGDYIDLSEGQSVISKIQWSDIDGESYGPDDGIFDTRLSGAHVMTAQGALVRSTADLDAKVYDDGDAELVPVAFYMGPATKAPSLV